MKTRSKLLLAAVSLLTVSVAATATSAYAWYTANRQVSAKLNQMAVQATSGTLSISHDTTVDDSFATATDKVTLNNKTFALTGDASGMSLTDVSSKGDGTFIKPKFNHKNDTIVGEYEQDGEEKIGQKTVKLSGGVGEGATAINAYGVISLAIKISNSAAEGAGSLDIYIDPTHTSFTSSLASVKNSARFSIIELGENNKTSTYLYCNPTGNETLKYIESSSMTEKYLVNNSAMDAGEATTNQAAATTAQGEADWIQDKGTGKLFAKNSLVASSSGDTKTKPNGYLCTLDTSNAKEKSFIITMWVEGTDPDCTVGNTSLADSLLVEDLSLNLALYALEA